jgi:hypothetical protein
MTARRPDERRQRQRELNRDTVDGWRLFEYHRECVMNLLARPAATGRLALLGAGNCNDVDLTALVRVYDQVSLVDLDEDCLAAAVTRQGVHQSSDLQVRAPVDLGAFATTWGELGGQRLEPETAKDLARSRVREISDTPFDVAASLCLLTQLILPIAEGLGAQHPKCLELVQFERLVHLNLLIELLRPGGQAILISDMVATDTAANLLSMRHQQLPQEMYRLVEGHNFFTGINPYLIAHQLKNDQQFAAHVTGVELHSPWLWTIAPRRGYLVFAISFVRS